MIGDKGWSGREVVQVISEERGIRTQAELNHLVGYYNTESTDFSFNIFPSVLLQSILLIGRNP